MTKKSKILTTFSGKFGDILWSLPTVREVANKAGSPVDFGIMPAYQSLLSLLAMQPYINRAFVIDDWLCSGSPCGDQPWQPPKQEGYETEIHLTYRYHPGIPDTGISLVDFIPFQHTIELTKPVVPFIHVPNVPVKLEVEGKVCDYVAESSNQDYADLKKRFLRTLEDYCYCDATKLPSVTVGVGLLAAGELSWVDAALAIKNAIGYIGDRSANWVLANGVGQKNIFTYEPNPERHKHGRFGHTFGNPHGHEETVALGVSPEEAASQAFQHIQNWKKEKNSEINEAIAR